MSYSELRHRLEQTRPELDLVALDSAYAFAERAHANQERYSGEPFLVHPVHVATILAELNPDLLTLQVALLHDVLEDTDVTGEQLEKEFGPELSDLIQSFSKLSLIKIRPEDSDAEKWKRMFLAMAKDVRLVFVKLAERLHNMRTLEFVPKEKHQRIARESLLVHAAIASRLGLYSIKSELEDLCFKYLYPEAFLALSSELAVYREKSEVGMSHATSELEQYLVREGIPVEKVQGRFKHLWSIFQKMESKEKQSLDSLYDLFAVRVILPDVFKDDEEEVAHLYSTLGLIHQVYAPVPKRFKDYVAVPKANGYRSLHTTVLGLGGEVYSEPTEVQIRTLQMHREAELGIASHWSYKMGTRVKAPLDPKEQKKAREAVKRVQNLVQAEPDLFAMVQMWLEDFQHMLPPDRSKVEALLLEKCLSEEELGWIRKSRAFGQLSVRPELEEQLAWVRGLSSEKENSSHLDLYPDRIFALTPQRQVVELPRGSTPIDFAYMVHSEVGNKMVSVKVNGRIVPFEYELQNGDTVEILTRNNAKPNRYWYSIAKTSTARNKIRNWFNRQDREINIATGRFAVNKELLALGKPALDEKLTQLKEYAGKERALSDREQLLENVGLGTVSPFQIVKTLYPEETAGEQKEEILPAFLPQFTEKVVVTGEKDLPVVFSACCKPRPPHPIVGYVTRGQSIRIHRLSCRELSGLDGDRFVETMWQKNETQS